MFDPRELDILRDALDELAGGFEDLPPFAPDLDADALRNVLGEVARRMQDNYPYFHPQYAGQMLKPPHPVARLAYALSLWINPNNHALDGGPASSAMEKECVAELGRLFGWEDALGHLAGGGTMANLEALWVAGRLHADKAVVASVQAHYTHSRISSVLGLEFDEIGVDAAGRMDLAALEARLARGDVGTVVATVGTTGLGAVDPLAEIVPLARRHGARVHADAAYGGYFTLASGLSAASRRSFDALVDADSIVIDPHKHGLQPYGCGCILFRDPAVGRFYLHDSPYTYFTSGELHLGEIGLECSRPGAAAVALWATQRLMPLQAGGALAGDLDDCLEAARALWRHLVDSAHYVPLLAPELDIVVYAAQADDSETAGAKGRRIFEAAAKRDLHLAMIDLPTTFVRQRLPGIRATSPTMTCLRSVLMKPAQRDWVARIGAILDDCAAAD